MSEPKTPPARKPQDDLVKHPTRPQHDQQHGDRGEQKEPNRQGEKRR